MSTVAILGAGPIGAATAARLAERGRVGAIVLVDAAVDVAAGKALDIRQSGPIAKTDTAISAAPDALAASGASVIVVADEARDGDWSADRGLNLVRQLTRAGSTAPIVFAGPSQTALMEACSRELKLAAHRLVGSAPAAMVGAVQALAGLELGLSSVDVTLVGRPPAFVVGWSAASAGGTRLTDRVAPHRLLAMSQALSKLWPPGPQAIGSATASIVEALIHGSRRLHPALAIAQGECGISGAAVVLPLLLGRLRVLERVVPSLSPQELTAFVNSLERT